MKYNYQKSADVYCSHTNIPALFMEQRVGKSYVAIRDVLRKGTFPVLIVAPYSAFLSWQTALADFKEESVALLEGNRDKRVNKLHNYYRWIITNYEAHRTIPEELYNVEWEAIILDESDYIKSPKAKVTKYFIKLGNDVTHKYILSGTAGLGNPLDYFCQLRFLSSDILGSNYYQFVKRFCYQPFFKWILRKSKREEFQNILKKYTYILKREDIPGFRKTTYEIIYVKKSDAFIKVENDLLYKYELNYNYHQKQTVWVTVMMQWYRRLSNGFAFNRIVDTMKFEALDTIIKVRSPVVIFACFTIEVLAIALRYNIPFINSSVSPKKRRELVSSYRGSIIINPHSFSMGGNLSHYNTVVFYSLPYSLRTTLQATDRLVAIEKDTHCIYLLREDTIDGDIYRGHQKNLKEHTLIQSIARKYTLIAGGKNGYRN